VQISKTGNTIVGETSENVDELACVKCGESKGWLNVIRQQE